MRKVINGRMYNTETAKEVYEHDNGFPQNDFRWCAVTLYKKKTGEFFLYGRGGAASPYCEYYGDSRGSGERIDPITEEQARDWLEEYGDADAYETAFGEVEE